MRRASRFAPASLLLTLALAPVTRANAEEQELRVFAAASLTEPVGQLAERFDGARVIASFGASSELARQIADGAPAGVFISASPEWVDFLREKGALAGEPAVFARNTLVCIAPRGSGLGAAGVRDLASLFSKGLAADDLVAIADAGVPAGDYARQALRAAGLLESNERRLVGRRDVRAVLQSVESSETRAGLVYATDARVAEVEVLFRLDPASHAPVVYVAAATQNAAHPDVARRFVEFLRGAEAQQLLARAGFLAP